MEMKSKRTADIINTQIRTPPSHKIKTQYSKYKIS